MTYRGTVKNGVIVPDGSVALSDGARVSFEIVEAAGEFPRGSLAALRSLRGLKWAGDPTELDRLLEEVQRDRDADLMPLDDE